MNAQIINVIAIFGESGSGKDSMVKDLVTERPDLFSLVVNTTTREMRTGQAEGVEYHFISEEEFANEVFAGEMLSYRQYGNGTWYGTSINALCSDKINIGAFSIGQVLDLLNCENIHVIPVYLSVKPQTRLRRVLSRPLCDCHQICRRFLSDEEDYAIIPFYHYHAFNEYIIDKNLIMTELIRLTQTGQILRYKKINTDKLIWVNLVNPNPKILH